MKTIISTIIFSIAIISGAYLLGSSYVDRSRPEGSTRPRHRPDRSGTRCSRIIREVGTGQQRLRIARSRRSTRPTRTWRHDPRVRSGDPEAVGGTDHCRARTDAPRLAHHSLGCAGNRRSITFRGGEVENLGRHGEGTLGAGGKEICQPTGGVSKDLRRGSPIGQARRAHR